MITGSNRATGYAIARRLHGLGWSVVSINRTLRGEPWLHEHLCDFTDDDSPIAVADDIRRTHGRVDAFVSTSVTRELCEVEDLSPARLNDAVRINFTSVVQTVRVLLPELRRANGLVVLLGSHAGSRHFEGGTAYSATKAALKAFVETLLLEERPRGVRSTLVSPGAIANFADDDSPDKMSTDSVARCVAALLSEMPEDTAIGEVELRPARIPRPQVSGLDRLRHV
ncbi:SDR family oxidoreductase [Saccharomonospora iraqiensis]|uniref:SDR family oxidoreductase n=1 Tax=Saccharomonospora iraqiensis TaxID=52698 RepID=UPI0018DC2915|nr:SDR family oxidoreductase [Saccharomonospora iraqiensis]